MDGTVTEPVAQLVQLILKVPGSEVLNVLADVRLPLIAEGPPLPDMPAEATRTLTVDTRPLAIVLRALADEIDRAHAETPPIPAGLCGVLGCTFTVGHDGVHTWEV